MGKTINISETISDTTVYRLEKELGSGGGGTVYKAWHEGLNKYVVIKEVHSDLKKDIETQRNEVEALKNVKSAYLPQVFGFMEKNGRSFTVMEFVEGESLDKHLERGRRFSQAQVVKWYGQLASALEAIHKKDIAHRDIKPANIMLLPNGDVCLIDFNAALVGGNDVQLVSRSLGYASPEQYVIFEKKFQEIQAAQQGKRKDTGAYAAGSGMETEWMGESKRETAGIRGSELQNRGRTEGPGESRGSQTVELLGGSKDAQTTELVKEDRDATKTELLRGNKDAQTTELLGEGKDFPETELLGESKGSQTTELLGENKNFQTTELLEENKTEETDWKRSDIYSLGATMYHLLSGECPAKKAKEVVPVSKLGNFGEGIVYMIEQSMQIDPSKRFSSGEVLVKALKNIHKYDTFWKKWWAKRMAAAILLPLTFALFAGTALLGKNVMAQEKEENYYAALYEIEHGSNPEDSYQEALGMFWNRIEPYRAMAKRLWEDGDLESCIAYIESNLGNIAKFQEDPEAAHGFGDLYYILGNCYCYPFGEPDYTVAADNLGIAVQYVKENPNYYRDYAVALAKKGDIKEAERALEKAQVLGLDAGSLNLLKGELAYAKQEYDSALADFEKAVAQTEDDEIRYRACRSLDEIFKLQNQPERSVVLLKEELSNIPVNRVAEMTERLADAYVKCGENEQAIALFEQLTQAGTLQFHLWQNLAVLLQQEGAMERAADCLEKMSELFPDDYRVPMRQAYLEADKQSKVPNGERDYSVMKRYYDMAAGFYNRSVRAGNTDPEMQQLDMLVEQLKINQWIENN